MNPADGSLILPRVNVEWGTLNLTSPSASGSTFEGINVEGLGPLVYDVRVSLEDQGQTPTGSMKWNPAAPSYALYEKCIAKFIEYSIMVTYYYVTGKSITFEYFWAGQSEVYGKEMELTVKMVSLMDGLVNANFFASVQADKDEKGKSFKDSTELLKKQYGISGVPELERRGPFIRYTDQAGKDASEAIVKVNYNDGSTFMDAVQNLVKDNGNNVFFNNINASNVVIFGPYTHEGLSEQSIVELPDRTSNSPDPRKRYAHLIGPGIIQSFTRTMEWQPPQKSQEISAILARKKEDEKERKRQQSSRKGKDGSSPASNPPTAQSVSARASTLPSGVHGSKTSVNIRSQNNYIGPIKQDMFTKERACKLSFTTLMCPSLVGIKPLDIVFIPSYDGQYLEDWIVSSVEYQQTQGGVDLAIQANRVYGSDKPMSIASNERIREFFGSINLKGLAGVGGFVSEGVNKTPTATLQSWMDYAWKLYLGFNQPQTPAPSSPSPTSQGYQQPQQRVGSYPVAPVSPSQLSPEERADYDKLNQEYPLLPADKAFTVKQTDPTNPGSTVLQSNDELFFQWASVQTVKPQGISFDPQTQTVSGANLESTQRFYTNVYAKDRPDYLGGLVREAYTRNRGATP